MWLINGTAVRGRSHISSGAPCQDKIAWKTDGSAYAVALADGAGSAALSQLGAEKCVDVITQYFLEHFDECHADTDEDRLKSNIYKLLLENLEKTAEEMNCPIKALACTLLCVAVKGERCISLHLGDGIIAYKDANGLNVYSTPDNGEYSNITYFVTTDNALSKIRIRRESLKDTEAFYLMSDGAGASLYNPLKNEASKALSTLSNLSLFYSEKDVSDEISEFFEQYIKTRTVDDCSMVYLVKHQRPSEVLKQMPYGEQLEFLDIKKDSKHEKKRYQRLYGILDFCSIGKSVQSISRHIGVRLKYGRYYVKNLLDLKLLKKNASSLYVVANSTDDNK